MEFSRRIRLILVYDGTDFHGWQKQVSGKGIQNTLEEALCKILNVENLVTVGSGRTDSGVHALCQNVHFDLPAELTHPDLVYGLNRLLPYTLRVQKAYFAPAEYHAQISAVRKTYQYRILQSDVSCPLRRLYTWWPAKRLNIELLNSVAQTITGSHDFKSFQSSGTPVKSTIRKIETALWQQLGDELVFTITGNGFLKQMVRNIVSSSVELTLRSENPSLAMKELMAVCDRTQMGPPAPAQGLSLLNVEYPKDLESRCTPLPKKISF